MSKKTQHIKHINKAFPSEAHTPMYNWHKFWTRKPHNVIQEYIDKYSKPGDIILDPFAGSGVTLIEAIRTGRKVIGIDIIPFAIDLWKATIDHIDIDSIDKEFSSIEKKIKSKILELYSTTCRACKRNINIICTIWKEDRPREIRYKCQFCGDIREKNCYLNAQDKKNLSSIKKKKISAWYPKNKFYYPDGSPFMTLQGYDSIDKLFTKRNLYALAILYEAINNSCSKNTLPYMRLVFTSMVHLCSKMCPVRPTRPFSSLWAINSFWVAPESMESNVWEKFESAYRGRQSFKRGKIESNRVLPNAKPAKNLKELGKKDKLYFPICSSSLIAIRNLRNQHFKHTGKEEPFVDYVFTDPPYAGSVQFGESTYLWMSWLYPELDAKSYLKYLLDHEVILNDKQKKNFDTYYSMLHATFKEIANVLKPGRYMHLTFHNPTTKIRNATIRAAMFAGFIYEKIIYQPPPRSSALALLRPFGSADGDFYFRFRKAETDPTAKMKEVDEHLFEKIVVETTKQVLAERGEPTPYTHIINYIDPVLSKHGYFLSLHPKKDVKDILNKHINKEFELVTLTVGEKEGKAWWFKDMSIVYRLEQIPLTERIEATVLRELQSSYTVSFTNVLSKVYTEFPNALTPDTTDVKDILQEYAEKTSEGLWRYKSLEEVIINQHSEMIYYIAQIGKKFGYEVYIGKKEQSERHMMKQLKAYNTQKKLTLDSLSPNQFNKAELIDIIWYQEKKIKQIFEVENTTMLTEAILRASHIPYDIKKFMILPLDRNRFLHRRLKSPLFHRLFHEQQWKILYYEDLVRLFNKRNLKEQDFEKAACIKPLILEKKATIRKQKSKPKQLLLE